MNERKNNIDGNWLKVAVEATGESIHSAGLKLGYKRNDKLYYHINNRSYLKAESLAELSKVFPRINLHYVLTGQGPAILPAQPPQPDQAKGIEI